MFRRRMLILVACYSLVFLFAVGRLVELQIVRSAKLREDGRQRRHRLVAIAPTRGTIKDRVGRIVAEDRPSYDLWLVPAGLDSVGRRRVAVSLLGSALSPQRLLTLADSRGAQAELRREQALADLRETRLVRRLSSLLKQAPDVVAEQILISAVERQAGSVGELLAARPCFDDVPFEAFLAVKQSRGDAHRDPGGILDAVVPRIGAKRVYPAGEVMGHITGYTGNLTREEYEVLRGYWADGEKHAGAGVILDHGRVFFALADADEADDTDDAAIEENIIRLRETHRHGEAVYTSGYFPNETVGRSGMEQYYNQRLRGRHTQRHLYLARPDPDGPRRLVTQGRPAVPRRGDEIALTLNLEFQTAVHNILLQAVDHAVVRSPFIPPDARVDWDARVPPEKRTAACVLMNCNNGEIYAMVSIPGYDPGTLRETFADLLKDPRTPLLNRVTQGQYPPGSIMKPVVALAGLMDKKLDLETTSHCEGAIYLGRNRYRCMHHHYDIALIDAIEESCNIYFYNAGKAIGHERLYHWYFKLGLGHRTGIDIAGELPGQLPVSARTGRGWSTGNTYHIAIGQGPMTATPLQIAVAYAAIANGGRIVRPHVLYDPMLRVPQSEFMLDAQALGAVRQGMYDVVQGDRGTARKPSQARIRGLELAGKTGSAEHKRGMPTHSWFACYAPFENPEVVCVVIVPAGGYGGESAAPIAKQVLLRFFDHVEPVENEYEEEAVG